MNLSPSTIHRTLDVKDPRSSSMRGSDMGNDVDDVNDDEANVPTWADFVENTSVHGLRYIFEPTAFKARRLFWCLVLGAGAAFFLYQVAERSRDYLRYDTSVAVKIMSELTEQTFPAVTLCNQNTFRSTVAVQRGLYSFIDQVYNVQESILKDDPESVRTRNFYNEAGHSILDMVERCTWNGRECNLSVDFHETITDMGLCYTFNSGRNMEPLTTSESGAGTGLSLVVNVEQYEYMRGPQNEAGVKMLLHTPSDTPLMREQGFAVAPGLHTFVNIQRSLDIQLEPPHGSCSKDADPRSVCITKTRLAKVQDVCQCVHPLLLEEYDDSAELAGDPNCPAPCSQVVYKSSLSYSLLSGFNMDMLIFGGQAGAVRQHRIQQKFLLARETAQWVLTEEVQQNQLLMGSTAGLIEMLSDLLDYNVPLIHTTSALAAEFDVADVVLGSPGFSETDFFLLANRGGRHVVSLTREVGVLVEEVQTYGLGFNALLNFYEPLHDGKFCVEEAVRACHDMGFEHNISDDLIFTLDETQPDQFFTIAEDIVLSGECSAQGYEWNQSTCVSFVDRKVAKLKNVAESFGYFTVGLEKVGTIKEQYMDYIHRLYDNTAKDPDEITEHAECLSVLDELHDGILPNMELLIGGIRNLVQIRTLSEFNNATKAILNSNMSMSNLSGMATDVWNKLDKCKWLEQYCVSCIDEGPIYETYEFVLVKMAYLQQKSSAALSVYATLYPVLSRIHKYVNNNLKGLAYQLRQYLNHSTTKDAVARKLDSTFLGKVQSELPPMFQDYSRGMQEYLATVQLLKDDMLFAYTESLNFTVPLLNDEALWTMTAFWPNMVEGSPSEEMSNLSSTFTQDRLGKLQDICDLLFYPFLDYLEDTSGKLIDDNRRLLESMKPLHENLLSYKEGNEMDADFYWDNFLQVDLFYKDLSYRIVEQREAFGMLSLLSEVGGSMGLFLGMTVLSMCEFLDYICLILVYKARKCGQTKKR